MSVEGICAIVACAISCAGVFIFVGRTMGTLQGIGDGVKVALQKTDKHDTEIAEIKIDLAKVKTKQEDCGTCP